jgi:four helix bundle protein
MPLFRTLRVWQKSHELVLDVCGVAKGLPADERFGLKSQMQSAAYSVPTNIAEGQKRGTDRDFAQFLAIASGSLAELQYLLILVSDLHYVAVTGGQRLIQKADEVERMLTAFQATVQARAARRGDLATATESLSASSRAPD